MWLRFILPARMMDIFLVDEPKALYVSNMEPSSTS